MIIGQITGTGGRAAPAVLNEESSAEKRKSCIGLYWPQVRPDAVKFWKG